MHPAVRRLTQLLKPPTAGADTLPWQNIQAEWGTTFPQDYRDFMNIYGPGGIDGIIAIATPENRDEPGYLTVRRTTPRVASEYRTFRGKWTFLAWPAPGALLGWGVTPIGHDLLWRATGNDPDDWPVVLAAYRDGAAYEFPYGMAEFLARMLGDPADRPTDLPGVLGHPDSRFLPVPEERAFRDVRQNPWGYVDEFMEERARERAERDPVTWISVPGRSTSDVPPVPRMTIEGFGLDGDALRVTATLDVEISAPVRVKVSIESPDGDVLDRQDVEATAELSNGLLVLNIRLPEAMNGTGLIWRRS
ncbi:hypothetical protein ACIQVL_39270 [Streptomyces sp. NPDC090499]|uniref:hypothetical protein n=1 Tax=Streptomyces sp. NPDC090499 TaxID=3365965 RepID=UPI00381FB1C8